MRLRFAEGNSALEGFLVLLVTKAFPDFPSQVLLSISIWAVLSSRGVCEDEIPDERGEIRFHEFDFEEASGSRQVETESEGDLHVPEGTQHAPEGDLHVPDLDTSESKTVKKILLKKMLLKKILLKKILLKKMLLKKAPLFKLLLLKSLKKLKLLKLPIKLKMKIFLLKILPKLLLLKLPLKLKFHLLKLVPKLTLLKLPFEKLKGGIPFLPPKGGSPIPFIGGGAYKYIGGYLPIPMYHPSHFYMFG